MQAGSCTSCARRRRCRPRRTCTTSHRTQHKYDNNDDDNHDGGNSNSDGCCWLRVLCTRRAPINPADVIVTQRIINFRCYLLFAPEGRDEHSGAQRESATWKCVYIYYTHDVRMYSTIFGVPACAHVRRKHATASACARYADKSYTNRAAGAQSELHNVLRSKHTRRLTYARQRIILKHLLCFSVYERGSDKSMCQRSWYLGKIK